jgi:hypothetical protein
MSEGAAELMKWLGESYVEARFPGHKFWHFTPAKGDVRAAELRALGFLYFGGPSQLTDKSVAWIMANRPTPRIDVVAAASHASLPPISRPAKTARRPQQGPERYASALSLLGGVAVRSQGKR